MNGPAKKARGISEYALWKYLTKLSDTSVEDIIIIVMNSEA